MNGNKTNFIKIMTQSLLCVVLLHIVIFSPNIVCLTAWTGTHYNSSFVSLLVTKLSKMA